MKIAMISDTHSLTIPDDQMPEADVLVHAGDMCSTGRLREVVAQAAWLERLSQEKYADVVVIAGNHDFALEAFYKENKEKELREKIFNKRVHYLRDSGVTIGGLHFYGMPWQPRFYDWAFNEDRGLKMKRWTEQIPMYTDVLVTHGPPHGILDFVGYSGGLRVGCEDLFDRVKIVKPRLHVFGHIHSAYGYKLSEGTEYFNAAVVNERYEMAHEPWVTEI